MSRGLKFGRARRRAKCPVLFCDQHRAPTHFCCTVCWGRLPARFRLRIIEERETCRRAGIEHSQELHALRDDAVALLSREARDRYSKPQGDQLSLIPS